jgi:cyclophilin family peptidyl-prolyl cis-trans isomerase
MIKQMKINQFPVALLILGCVFTVLLFSCSQQDKKASEPSTEQTDTGDTDEAAKPEDETVIKQAADAEKTEPEAKPMIEPANAIAVIQTAKGNIEFEFYATDAPQTSKNFIKNASKGYYRSAPFHRVDEFVIQAGSDFADETLAFEKSDHPLEKGVVLMVTAPGASVADGDEFMICKTAIALDDDYTTLGKVIKGLDVLDSIEQDEKIVNITIREREKE